MNILTISILWVIGCIALCLLNAKFWQIMPDLEDKQYQANKARNIKPMNPILQDTWHTVRVFIFIFLLSFVVWLICNAI